MSLLESPQGVLYPDNYNPAEYPELVNPNDYLDPNSVPNPNDLPQIDDMRLVHRVVDFNEAERTITGQVDVTDRVVAGHFGIVPGVKIVEHGAQVACLYALNDKDIPLFTKINQAVFKKIVLLGDTLETKMTMGEMRGRLIGAEGTVRIIDPSNVKRHGKVACEVDIEFSIGNKEDFFALLESQKK